MPVSRKMILGGTVVYMGGLFVAYQWLYPTPTAPAEEAQAHQERQPTKEERRQVMNRIAPIYDSDLVKSNTEWWLGITRMRKNLLAQASGRTLEIAGGTGKNLPHYTPQCGSLLLIDSSDMMVQTALWKFRALQKAGKLNFQAETAVSFQKMDAENLALPDASFDTVVDSYGLCSFDDPLQALREMARVCKPDGRILLLEHGRSPFAWLNSWLLDRTATSHAWKYGCTWNRDISQLVEEAGLVIHSHKRKHFGTNSIIVASPSSSLSSSDKE